MHSAQWSDEHSKGKFLCVKEDYVGHNIEHIVSQLMSQSAVPAAVRAAVPAAVRAVVPAAVRAAVFSQSSISSILSFHRTSFYWFNRTIHVCAVEFWCLILLLFTLVCLQCSRSNSMYETRFY